MRLTEIATYRVREVVPRSKEMLSRSSAALSRLTPAWHEALERIRRSRQPSRAARIARALGRMSRRRRASLLVVAGAAVAATALAVWLVRWERREAAVRGGGHFDIVRCPVHGIAYDAELEECTECAKAAREDPTRLAASLR